MKLPSLPPEIMREIDRHVPLELLKALPEPSRETKEQMIATVTGWVDGIADRLTVEAGRLPLRNAIRSAVRDGTLPTLAVIKAAERYREVDIALRELIAEGLDQDDGMPELSRTSLRSFQQQAILRDITVDPKGQTAVHNWHRDIGIAALMTVTLLRFPYLKKGQNRASKNPSAGYIVAEASCVGASSQPRRI